MRFACQTFFDITATGVTGHYKSSRVPFQDQTGRLITNIETWNRARNKQRNWETLTQLISMRAQLFDLLEPIVHQDLWSFEFEVETPSVYGTPENPIEVLQVDAEGVPMLINLDNREEVSPFLIMSGPSQNIWFMPISINT